MPPLPPSRTLLRRSATALLALAFAAACLWWACYIPPDPDALYRPLPADTLAAIRVLDLPARWDGISRNPLLAIALDQAGLSPADAYALSVDPESRAWFEKLAGPRSLFAASPAGWMGVSWLGGGAQRLRWQLEIFRPAGYVRIRGTPGHLPVWRVDGFPGATPDRLLHIAFGDGTLYATLSPDPALVCRMAAAAKGHCARLLDVSDSFRRFADDASANPDPVRLWLSRTAFGADASSTIAATPSSLHLDLLAAAGSLLDGLPANRPAPSGLADLPAHIGSSAAAAALFQTAGIPWLLRFSPYLHPDFRHALRMASDIANDSIAAFVLDGPLSGRLSVAGMSTFGMGLKVPTLLLVTRDAPTPAAREAAVSRILASCNNRYRGTFLFREIAENGTTFHVLGSEHGNEWVDSLSLADRPAYAATPSGWLFLSSNLAALRTLLAPAPAAPAPLPGWSPLLSAEGAAALWLDFPRADRILRDLVGLWRLASRLMDRDVPETERLALETAKMWSARLIPFQSLSAGIGGNAEDDGCWASLDLGLPPSAPLD